LKGKNIFLSVIILFGLTGCWDNNLIVVDPWSRPGNQGGNSAIYFGIDNPTNQPDVLLDTTSDVAVEIEIHLSMLDDQGLMTMEHQETVTIAPRTKLMFQPGGLHVMLINLRRNLEVGDNFPLELNFQEAGKIQIDVVVREP
jgi:periplasmic copper chaperone A